MRPWAARVVVLLGRRMRRERHCTADLGEARTVLVDHMVGSVVGRTEVAARGHHRNHLAVEEDTHSPAVEADSDLAGEVDHRAVRHTVAGVHRTEVVDSLGSSGEGLVVVRRAEVGYMRRMVVLKDERVS